MHTRPLRDEILREREVETSLQAALQRIALSYWALGNRLRHAVQAPIDALTALVLERPHLGGALQQDVGEAFPEFPLRAAAAFSPCNDSAGVMCEHVLLGKLGPHVLQRDSISLQALCEEFTEAWASADTLPECVVLAMPTVYEAVGGGYRYSALKITDVDSLGPLPHCIVLPTVLH